MEQPCTGHVPGQAVGDVCLYVYVAWQFLWTEHLGRAVCVVVLQKLLQAFQSLLEEHVKPHPELVLRPLNTRTACYMSSPVAPMTYTLQEVNIRCVRRLPPSCLHKSIRSSALGSWLLCRWGEEEGGHIHHAIEEERTGPK